MLKIILFVLAGFLGWQAINVAVEAAANHKPGTAMILFAMAVFCAIVGAAQACKADLNSAARASSTTTPGSRCF